LNEKTKRKAKSIATLLIVTCSIIISIYFLRSVFLKKQPEADYSIVPPALLPISNDFDKDGLSNKIELIYGTNPFDADSENDGIIDGNETLWNKDSDGDQLINALGQDSDNDMPPDSLEDKNGGGKLDAGETNTTNADTDMDGLSDGVEDLNLNSIRELNEPDSLNNDTDGDGLQDGKETTMPEFHIKNFSA